MLVEGRSHRDAARLTGRLRDHQIVVFEGPDRRSPANWSASTSESATPLTLAGSLWRPLPLIEPYVQKR